MFHRLEKDVIRPYFLIGAGGTGTYLYDALRRSLITYYSNREDDHFLTVMDGKEISADKLDRQMFFADHVGHNKAEALVAQYSSDPRTILAVPEYLKKSNISRLVEHCVILIAADNYPVRARIERHVKNLDNAVVINGGNELFDGSLQTYVRRDGQDITAPLSQGHPEILRKDKNDPATLSCEEIALLPSGQQTIIANMQSATLMLNALDTLHKWEADPTKPYPRGEEVFFDLSTWAMRATNRPTSESSPT